VLAAFNHEHGRGTDKSKASRGNWKCNRKIIKRYRKELAYN
jgi:hypothetical protein